ncbi:MAG: Gfo/Idh/MocA family oxidoreductase [Armatimonadetes bacterium]|nr:Gfo/Idh/MocA family oxidoreductase [Armatimonadota bacterium]
MATGTRIALIGCGGIIRWHVSELKQHTQAEIVALCDIVPEQMEKLGTEHPHLAQVPRFTEIAPLLAETKPDAVIIATPHTLHRAQIEQCFDAGCHVLAEKPLATSVDDARAAIAARDRSGKIGGISYQRHGQGVFKWLRGTVQSGQFGKVRAVDSHLGQQWYQFTRGSWRQEKALSGGGQINDSGSHMIDILLWATMLKPQRVTAFMDDLDTEVDINSVVSVQFHGGAMASLTIVGDAALWHERHAVWFEEAMIEIEGEKVRVFERNGRRWTVEQWEQSVHPCVNFVRAIEQGDEVIAPFESGLATISLTEAAWQSGYGGNVPVDCADI